MAKAIGMAMEGLRSFSGTGNDYRYNGKELNEDLGLNLFDYGARWYDPALGRFAGIDPIADKFVYLSPYNYASNDPIKNIDLHGRQGLHFSLAVKLATYIASRSNNNNKITAVNNLVVGTQSQKIQASSNLHAASNFATDIQSNLKNPDTYLNAAKASAQDIGAAADYVEGAALATTALTGGATSPVTGPLAGAAAATGIICAGVEVGVDVIQGNADESSIIGAEVKALSIGGGELIDKGVDLLKIGGSYVDETIKAVQATGNGILNVAEEVIQEKVKPKENKP